MILFLSVIKGYTKLVSTTVMKQQADSFKKEFHTSASNLSEIKKLEF